MSEAVVTGRCYCGACVLSARAAPLAVAYCHCADCRRWTGAPLPAFAAFASAMLDADLGAPLEAVKGVRRWCCPTCGSPLAACFDYLPGQTYVPLGVLDQADRLPPGLHCHADRQMPWLHVVDDAPRAGVSARDQLNAAGKPCD